MRLLALTSLLLAAACASSGAPAPADETAAATDRAEEAPADEASPPAPEEDARVLPEVRYYQIADA